MAETDPYGAKRKQEEEFFRQREAELIEKMRDKARREGLRARMAEKIGVQDQEALEILMEMGFDKDTVMLLPLMPLLMVAWADGAISRKEREGILSAAAARGVLPGTPAHAQLSAWLEVSPGEQHFAKALTVIRALLVDLPEVQRDSWEGDLSQACRAIAEASGGILGFGKVSAEEEAALAAIAAEVQKAHQTAAAKVAGSV